MSIPTAFKRVLHAAEVSSKNMIQKISTMTEVEDLIKQVLHLGLLDTKNFFLVNLARRGDSVSTHCLKQVSFSQTWHNNLI